VSGPRPRECGPWEPLRALRRRLLAAQNHSHYVGRAASKEQPLLEELIARDPPQGGLANYLRDLSRTSDEEKT
jgi:hypothetical protein